MGSQRRRAEALMEHFLITEAEAYKLGRLIDAVELGDDLSDATYAVEQEGDLESTLADLERLHASLGEGIEKIRAAFTPLKKRR